MNRNKWEPHPHSLEYITYLETVLERLPEGTVFIDPNFCDPEFLLIAEKMESCNEVHLWPAPGRRVSVAYSPEGIKAAGNDNQFWFVYGGVDYRIHYNSKEED